MKYRSGASLYGLSRRQCALNGSRDGVSSRKCLAPSQAAGSACTGTPPPEHAVFDRWHSTHAGTFRASSDGERGACSRV